MTTAALGVECSGRCGRRRLFAPLSPGQLAAEPTEQWPLQEEPWTCHACQRRARIEMATVMVLGLEFSVPKVLLDELGRLMALERKRQDKDRELATARLRELGVEPSGERRWWPVDEEE